jgi:hypothetical protein
LTPRPWTTSTGGFEIGQSIGKPSFHRGVADDHIAAPIETARRRALEPIMLEDDEVEIISTTPPSMT